MDRLESLLARLERVSLPKISASGSALTAASFPASTAASLSSSSSCSGGGGGYVQSQALAAAQLEEQQDVILEDMSHAVRRLADLSGDIR